jgi:hypothetical protein
MDEDEAVDWLEGVLSSGNGNGRKKAKTAAAAA